MDRSHSQIQVNNMPGARILPPACQPARVGCGGHKFHDALSSRVKNAIARLIRCNALRPACLLTVVVFNRGLFNSLAEAFRTEFWVWVLWLRLRGACELRRMGIVTQRFFFRVYPAALAKVDVGDVIVFPAAWYTFGELFRSLAFAFVRSISRCHGLALPLTITHHLSQLLWGQFSNPAFAFTDDSAG